MVRFMFAWMLGVVAVGACMPRSPSADEHPAVADARRLTATAQVLVAAGRVLCGDDAKCIAATSTAESVVESTQRALRAFDACKDDPQSGECIAAALDEVQALVPKLQAVIASRRNTCREQPASTAP